MAKGKIYWRVNENIHAPKVRVIDEKGKQIGLLDTGEALVRAKKVKLDLVEIAPNAKPPVAKIIEFGKFKYQEDKKLRKQKKGAKGGDIKEIRFSPFIGAADYETRIIRVKEFLNNKDKVRLVVKFKGRQMGSKQYGYDLLKRILDSFENQVSVDMEPKFMGRHLMMVISPVAKSREAGEQGSKKKNYAKAKN